MWMLWIGALLFVACLPRRAAVIRTDFETDDPILAAALKAAADKWAQAGVLVASIVTVNEGVPGAMKVIRTPRAMLYRHCHQKPTYGGDGCTAVENHRYDAIYIPIELTDPGRLEVVLMHEMGHVFINDAAHHEGKGVMHPNATSVDVTDTDLDFMAQYTEVVPVEEPEDPSRAPGYRPVVGPMKTPAQVGYRLPGVRRRRVQPRVGCASSPQRGI